MLIVDSCFVDSQRESERGTWQQRRDQYSHYLVNIPNCDIALWARDGNNLVDMLPGGPDVKMHFAQSRSTEKKESLVKKLTYHGDFGDVFLTTKKGAMPRLISDYSVFYTPCWRSMPSLLALSETLDTMCILELSEQNQDENICKQLKLICSHPRTLKVIVTRHATLEMMRSQNLCSPEKVEYIFWGDRSSLSLISTNSNSENLHCETKKPAIMQEDGIPAPSSKKKLNDKKKLEIGVCDTRQDEKDKTKDKDSNKWQEKMWQHICQRCALNHLPLAFHLIQSSDCLLTTEKPKMDLIISLDSTEFPPLHCVQRAVSDGAAIMCADSLGLNSSLFFPGGKLLQPHKEFFLLGNSLSNVRKEEEKEEEEEEEEEFENTDDEIGSDSDDDKNSKSNVLTSDPHTKMQEDEIMYYLKKYVAKKEKLQKVKNAGLAKLRQLLDPQRTFWRCSNVINSCLSPQTLKKLKEQIIKSLSSIPCDFGGGCSIDKAVRMAEFIVTNKFRCAVEIGVYRGRSLLAQALAMKETNGVVYGIDAWCKLEAMQEDLEKEKCLIQAFGDSDKVRTILKNWILQTNFDDVYRGVETVVAGNKDCIHLLRQRSATAHGHIPKIIDMLHIDGNHDTTKVMKDIEIYVPLVKPYGYIILSSTDFDSVQQAFSALGKDCVLLERHDSWAVWSK